MYSSELEAMKVEFRQEVNSKRAIDSVNNLAQLRLLLNKRLSTKILLLPEENLIPLNSINNDLEFNIPSPNNIITRLPVTQDRKEQLNIIYMYICENLGHKWKDFARNVGVKEGYIDDLSRNEKSIQDNVFKILLHHQQLCDPTNWRQQLLLALENCRRKDMKKHVESLLDRFKIIDPFK